MKAKKAAASYPVEPARGQEEIKRIWKRKHAKRVKEIQSEHDQTRAIG